MTLIERLRAGTTEPTHIENVVRTVPASPLMIEAAERIAELEKQISDIHASTRRMSFREEWYLGGLRNQPGDYVLMMIGPVTSEDVPF